LDGINLIQKIIHFIQAILRNPKVRLAGVKYLSKRLQKTYIDPEENEDDAAHSDSDMEDEPSVQSPNKLKGQGMDSLAGDNVQLDTQSNVEPGDTSTVKEESKEDTEEMNRYYRYQPTAEDEAFLKSLGNFLGKSLSLILLQR